MTTDEFNKRVEENIAWMVRRNTKAPEPKPEPCHCAAYPFPHRFDPTGYCRDFLPEPDDKWGGERDGDYYEEKMLDDRHRAKDIQR